MSAAARKPLHGFSNFTSCEHCGRRLNVRIEVTRGPSGGTLEEEIEFCGCSKSRFAAGICQDCNQPVQGRVRWAERCAKHKAAARLRSYREHHRRYREKRNARHKAYSKRPEVRERKRLRARAWRRRNPDKVRASKKRYVARHPDKILESYARNSNAARPDRAIAKRQWARMNQTRYAGQNLKPVCDCGAEIPWSGRGRPAKKCENCDPKRWRYNRRKQAKKQEMAA